MKFYTLSTIFACALGHAVCGQSFEVQNPLDITPALSGNFGELRPNHFHAGIDLKTAGREGLEVKAAADGHVSRIKISPYGYGKVVYVDHPEGYTTVYAHLSKLSDSIERYAKSFQYAQQSFEIDIYPGKGDLPVKRGERIAFSGNTGGSGGPHLHFEVRETTTEVPRNPLLFGFPMNDSKKPVIDAIAIAPIGNGSKVNGLDQSLRARTSGSGITATTPVQVQGSFGVEVSGYDSQDGSVNRNGIYSIELFVDGVRISRFKADSIPFHQSRHLNALIDYEHYYKSGTRYTRLYRLPGNELENLDYQNAGVLDLEPGVHDIEVVASDISGNAQKIAFQVHAAPAEPANDNAAELLFWNLPYAYDSEYFKLFLPTHTVYENIPLAITEHPEEWPPRISILKPEIPVQEPFTIYIKPTQGMNTDGLLIMQTNAQGKAIRALSTRKDGEWMVAESKFFGSFALLTDDQAPDVKSVNFRPGETWQSGAMKFSAKDNLSGILAYSAEVNGKWVLMEYEPKQDLMTIDVTELPISEDVQQLTLKISDLAGNVATFGGTFYHK